MPPLRIAAAGAALAVAVASGCGPPPATDVLLIVIDTLRADRLGAYGHARDTSPVLDRLAEEGVRFERAYATASWTRPSIGSILTGLYPQSHGASGIELQLSDGVETLAETLRRSGYATAGIVSNSHLATKWGFARGFDAYDEEEVGGPNHVSTPGITRRAIEALGALTTGDRPFMLFVHYFDPHYNWRRHPEIGFAAERVDRLDGRQGIWPLRLAQGGLTARETDFLRDLYDEEIRFTDAGIGRLLGALERSGRADRTLVMVVADHGEEFLEHGWLGHTVALYEEIVRVPWIVRDPLARRVSRVIEEPVSLVSVVPTILELVGVEAEGDRFDGPSLAAAVRHGKRVVPEPLYAQAEYDPGTLDHPMKATHKEAIIGARFKLIRDASAPRRLEIYDLASDPNEKRRLRGEAHAEKEAELLDALDARVRLSRSRAAAPQRVGLSAEEVERLRQLGYLEP